MKSLQDEAEFARFKEILRTENVRSYLEIGSMHGGSFLQVGETLPIPSKLVSLDTCNVTPSITASLEAAVRQVGKLGHDATLVVGDSTSRLIVRSVQALGPFDAVFIDGNHSLPYITADFENYTAGARIVAVHDIAWHREPTWKGRRIEVPEWWREHKSKYRHQEIKMCPTRKNNGIGVLWMI